MTKEQATRVIAASAADHTSVFVVWSDGPPIGYAVGFTPTAPAQNVEVLNTAADGFDMLFAPAGDTDSAEYIESPLHELRAWADGDEDLEGHGDDLLAWFSIDEWSAWLEAVTPIEKRMGPDDDYDVTVCAECLAASCWHGEFMCHASHTAGTTTRRASELRRLGREHPHHFSRAKIADVGA